MAINFTINYSNIPNNPKTLQKSVIQNKLIKSKSTDYSVIKHIAVKPIINPTYQKVKKDR